ncbi:hypothetical protein BJX70DRAFT_355886 [Aspergillus crustosus]
MRPPTEAEKASITRALLLDEGARHKQYPAYFRLYESIFCPEQGEDKIIEIDDPVLPAHADILECAYRLQANPNLTREELEGSLAADPAISHLNRKNAVRSVIRAAFMIDCFVKDKHSQNFEVGGYSPARWEESEPFVSYVDRAIPIPSIQNGSEFEGHMSKFTKNLKAWKLQKRCHLQFLPTDNITEHLLYDARTSSVQVFHHTAYLKAHLRRSIGQPIDQQASESLALGMLPPQLLLETLHSIHFILFPISKDRTGKSIKTLNTLIRKHWFDPNAQVDEGWIRQDARAKFKYYYWNDRLEKLYHLVRNPPPKNRLVGWIERHTNERNALTVALIALFLSAFFGLMTCLIGGAQLALAILAWRDAKP